MYFFLKLFWLQVSSMYESFDIYFFLFFKTSVNTSTNIITQNTKSHLLDETSSKNHQNWFSQTGKKEKAIYQNFFCSSSCTHLLVVIFIGISHKFKMYLMPSMILYWANLSDFSWHLRIICYVTPLINSLCKVKGKSSLIRGEGVSIYIEKS